MDYYQILGVSRDAPPEEIKKAYRKLSKEYHPDKKKGDKASEEKYKQINRAYEALSDPKKKQAYDQFGTEDGPQFGGGGAGFGGFGGFEGVGDIFETFFGGRRGGGGHAEQEGHAMEVRVGITLAEAFRGSTKKLRLRKIVACTACNGSGAEKDSKKVSCSTCKGSGQVTRTVQSFFGVLQQSMVCETCKGAGHIPEHPCKTCGGEGRVTGTEEVTIEIPPGINDGQTLRIHGKGEAGRQGAGAGDLYVHIRVEDDARFVRSGDDLRTDVTVQVADAVLGTDVRISTFEESVTLKIPAGTQPGQVLRVKGKGMPVVNASRRGDLYVHIIVEVPKKVGRKEKEMWEGLRRSL